MWNRDPASPSYGSFDRQYWGWKFKDFSDASLQYAVRLAVEYARLQNQTKALPCLLDAFVSFCAAIQRTDGSFDQCYPYERAPGVVYDILSTLIYVRDSPYLVSGKSRADLDVIIGKAAQFALRTDESHGAIANHFAGYAYELFNFANHSGNDVARSRAEDYLDRTLGLFERDEGWFQEYDGPDAGYQTRTLRYLTKTALLLDRPAIWEVIRKAADFVGELLMPDGSVHPMLGSRSTALVYPSAFEALAARDPGYRHLANRISLAWQQERVPLPSGIDFANAILLASDAWDAANWRDKRTVEQQDPTPRKSQVDFAKAGISIRRTSEREVYVGHRLGGVVVVYLREGGSWKPTYEDSGYLLSSPLNATRWITRMPGSGRLIEHSNDRYVVEANFQRSLHDEVTPLRMLLLRALNVSLLRFQSIADLFRKMVVRRLIMTRATAQLKLRREIVLAETVIHVTDTFTGDPTFQADGQTSLHRCRRVTGTHMASARYFQEQELEYTGTEWLEEIPLSLDVAHHRVLNNERSSK
jgi:hypothetical protein